jgi:putative protein-disulfide isomerase
MERLHEVYGDRIQFTPLSGGMIPPEHAQPLVNKAGYVANAYKTVEEYTGVRFGELYLHHIFHPEQSDWVEESLTPATALCLLKAAQPEDAIHFTSAIQKLHMQEGRNLSDGETYRPLVESLNLDANDFIRRLGEEEWQEEARYEFALVRQLGITGFPAAVLQTAADKFYLISRGYTPYNELADRLGRVLVEASAK